MTHTEFFAAIKARAFATVYLFEGEEEHIKQQALVQLRAALLPPGLEALNETILEGPSADEILAAAETLPMLVARRLVVVRESPLLEPGREKDETTQAGTLAEFLPRAPDSACLVFYCRGLPDGRKKTTLLLRKLATVVRFDPLEDGALAHWMRSQLKPYGKTIDGRNAALLAFTCGRELLTLARELQKLANYRPDSPAIEAEDIQALATPSLEYTVFQWVDAILADRQKDAFQLLRQMREQGESCVGILAMLTRQFRILLHLGLMQAEGKPPQEIQKTLGIPPFALRKAQDQARRFTLPALRHHLELLLDADDAVKSGRLREDVALERAVFHLR